MSWQPITLSAYESFMVSFFINQFGVTQVTARNFCNDLLNIQNKNGFALCVQQPSLGSLLGTAAGNPTRLAPAKSDGRPCFPGFITVLRSVGDFGDNLTFIACNSVQRVLPHGPKRGSTPVGCRIWTFDGDCIEVEETTDTVMRLLSEAQP